MIDSAQYRLQTAIPLFRFLDIQSPEEYISWVKEGLRREGAIKVFEEIYKLSHPVVVQTHIEEWRDHEAMYMKLHYQLTAVQTNRVQMFEMVPMTFVNHSGTPEWKCGYCGTINSMEATYCGEKHDHAVGCGHSRDKARQDY